MDKTRLSTKQDISSAKKEVHGKRTQKKAWKEDVLTPTQELKGQVQVTKTTKVD